MSHPTNPALNPGESRGGIRRTEPSAAAPGKLVLAGPSENGVYIPALILDMVSYQTAQCAGHRFTGAVDPDTLRQIGNLLTTVRWNYITNEESAKSVWEEHIAKNGNLLDYLLQLTQNVMFHLHGWSLVDQAIEMCGRVLSRPNSNVIHTALSNRLSSQAEVQKLLMDNPWLLVMQLAAMGTGAAQLGALIDDKRGGKLHLQEEEPGKK